MSKGRKRHREESSGENETAVIADDASSSLGKDSVKSFKKSNEKRLIVVLENASLDTVKTGKNHELLNCDRHLRLMKKIRTNPSECRPDITHQCLLMLLDSPLNRAGLLQVYVHTKSNALIEINPATRIPRTFDRFCGLMVQLLNKLSIKAADSSKKLLKIIKNPVTTYFPPGCRKIGTSFKSAVVDIKKLVPQDDSMVFVIGAMSHGSVDVDYTEEDVSFSNYPLSAALACTKLCSAFEDVWGIV